MIDRIISAYRILLLSIIITVLSCIALTGCNNIIKDGKDEGNMPIVTIYQGSWSPEEAIQYLGQFGANNVWMTDGNIVAAKAFKEAGYSTVMLTNPTMRVGEPANNNEYLYSYLKTRWYKKEGRDLVIDLLEDYSAFSLASANQSNLDILIQEKNSMTAITRDCYELDYKNNSVIVKFAEEGKYFRAVFLAREVEGFSNRSKVPTDGTVDSVLEKHMKQIQQLCINPYIDTIRPTSLVYFYPNYSNEIGTVAYSWYAYSRGTSPERIKKFQNQYGIEFNPLWLADTGYGEEGYIPDKNFLLWMDLIRKDVNKYAKEYVNVIHKSGKKARLFWGDSWIGMEPYLGDIDSAGFDEVVTSMNRGPLAVRTLMDFPGKVKKIIRMPWIRDFKAENMAKYWQDYNSQWKWIKREVLFDCPDGITISGDSIPDMAKTPLINNYIGILDEFKKIYSLINGQDIFKFKLNIYIVNTYGTKLSWTTSSIYLSQRTILRQMVDWPVNIKWISFDQIIRDGIPQDASLIIINGEPNTSWSGGNIWADQNLKSKIEEYVREGGGLLAIGGASYYNGKFALSDILGVEYAKPATKYSQEELWNISRWYDAGYEQKDFNQEKVYTKTTLGINNSLLAESYGKVSESALIINCDSKVNNIGALCIASSNDDHQAGIYLNEYGSGKTAYISGYGEFGRLFKSLCFYLAGKEDELDDLNTDTEGTAVYYYPERKIILAYNYGNAVIETNLKFNVELADKKPGSDIQLLNIDLNKTYSINANELKEGWKIELKPGEILKLLIK